jgi:hypothetical protein
MTGLESAVCQLTIFVFICKTDKSEQVKQEVNCTVILPPLVFPGLTLVGFSRLAQCWWVRLAAYPRVEHLNDALLG